MTKIVYDQKIYADSIRMKLPSGYQIWWLVDQECYVGVTPEKELSYPFGKDDYAARRWCIRHARGEMGTQTQKIDKPEFRKFRGDKISNKPVTPIKDLHIVEPHIEMKLKTNDGEIFSLDEINLEIIVGVYKFCGYNKVRTAYALGIGIRTVQRKITEYFGKNDPGFSKEFADQRSQQILERRKENFELRRKDQDQQSPLN